MSKADEEATDYSAIPDNTQQDDSETRQESTTFEKDPQESRTWTQRTCSKIHPSSVRAGFITLFSSALGTGFLALPKATASWGYVGGLLMIGLAALNMAYSLHLLGSTVVRHAKLKYYADMVDHLMGKKWSLVLGLVLVFYLVGALVAYHLVIWKFFENLLEDSIASWIGFTVTSKTSNIMSAILYFFLATILLLPSASKTLDKLRYVASVSLIVIILLVVVIMIQTNSYITQYKPTYKAFGDDIWGYTTNFGVFIFAYNCVGSYHQVASNMKNATEKRLRKASFRNCITLFVFYFISASLAYFSVGQDLVSLKIDLFPNRPALAGSSDILMKIIKGSVVFSIFACYLNNIIPLKDLIVSVFKIDYEGRKNNWIMTLSFCYGPAILAWAYPHVSDWFSILGSFCCGFIIIFFPGMMYYMDHKNRAKEEGRQLELKAKIALVWTLVMLLLCLISAVTVLLKMVNIIKVN